MKITQSTSIYQGVIVFTSDNLAIGFATMARSTDECKKIAPTGIVAFHVADVGEYLREENQLDANN